MRKTVYAHLAARGGLTQHNAHSEIPKETAAVVKPAIDRSCNAVCEITQWKAHKGEGGSGRPEINPS
jgi:hypothetical protein